MPIRPFVTADYPALARLQSQVWGFELSPEGLVQEDQQRPPHHQFGRWVAHQDEEVVGVAWLEQDRVMYHPRKFWVNVLVDPNHRGQGLGGALYRVLEPQLQRLGALSARVALAEHDAAGLHFATRQGYVESLRMWEASLDMYGVDLQAYGDLASAAEVGGVRIVTLRELENDPERERKLHELYTELETHLPTPDPVTPVSLGEFKERRLYRPQLLPDAYFVAVDGGRYVGVSNIWGRVGNDRAYLGLTGVLPPYRRRRIALAMKLRGIIAARQQGFRWLHTENVSTNLPIVGLNQQLGFVNQPAWVHVVKLFGNT